MSTSSAEDVILIDDDVITIEDDDDEKQIRTRKKRKLFRRNPASKIKCHRPSVNDVDCSTPTPVTDEKDNTTLSYAKSVLRNTLLNQQTNYQQTMPVVLQTETPSQPAGNWAPTTLLLSYQPVIQGTQQVMSQNVLVQNQGTNLMQSTVKVEESVVMIGNQTTGLFANMNPSLISENDDKMQNPCMLPISPKNTILRSYLTTNNPLNIYQDTTNQILTVNQNALPMLNTVVASPQVNCDLQGNITQTPQVIVNNVQGSVQVVPQQQQVQSVNYFPVVQPNYQFVSQAQTLGSINLSWSQPTNNLMGQLNPAQNQAVIITTPQQPQNVINLQTSQQQPQNIINLQTSLQQQPQNIINLQQLQPQNVINLQQINPHQQSQNIINLQTSQPPINLQPQNVINLQTLEQQIISTSSSSTTPSQPVTSFAKLVPKSDSAEVEELSPKTDSPEVTEVTPETDENQIASNQQFVERAKELLVETTHSISFEEEISANLICVELVKHLMKPPSPKVDDQQIVETTDSITFRKLRPDGAGKHEGGASGKGGINWSEVSSGNIISGKRPRRSVCTKIKTVTETSDSDSDEEESKEEDEEEELSDSYLEDLKESSSSSSSSSSDNDDDEDEKEEEEEKETNDQEEEEEEEVRIITEIDIKEENIIKEEDLDWESMIIIENDIECS